MGRIILNNEEYTGSSSSAPVTDVTVNGSSVVNAQGVAEVTAVQDNPTFTEASTRANIASGESFATILGKIKKWFSDLKTVAFSGSYNDLSDKPTIPDISTKVSKSGDTMSGTLNIEATNDTPLTLKRTNSSSSVMMNFFNQNGFIGGYVAGNDGNPYYRKSDGTYPRIALTSDIPDISTKVSKSGDTMSGNLNLQTGGEIYVKCQNTAKLTSAYLDSAGSGEHGIWSNGYYDTTFHNSGLWLINRGTDGTTYVDGTKVPHNAGLLRNTEYYRFQTGGSVNGTWYKMFQIAYSSYNVCTLRMIVKVGYMPMCEMDACIRFAPSGVSSSASSYIIKNLGGGVYDGGIRVKMYLVSTNTVGFAVQPFGSASDYGFEILDISSESQAIGVNQISVSSPFEQLPSEPTSFGVQIEEIISKNGHTTIDELEAEDFLQIYSTSFAKSVFLKAPSTISADRQISFPNKDGTIAMTSDISSRRYKENIIPLSEDEAKKILDVEIVNYDYKENVVDEDERYDQKGAIAEDVAELIPNAVTYADIDGEQLPDGINYTKFIPYLIKMVQMQQKEIEELKAMIKGE